LQVQLLDTRKHRRGVRPDGQYRVTSLLQIACGSANELEYHLLLAKDLGYLPHGDYDSIQKQFMEMKRMLVSLTRKVGGERRI
jgi:four helix bundle protein